MGLEIEHKFLVKSDEWRRLGVQVPIRQGFLALHTNARIRVRIMADKGYVTIKGKSSDGICHAEYEYEIPLADAEEMLATLAIRPVISKMRTYIPYAGHVIEVDEFQNENTGLIIAEIELKDLDEPFEKPEWLGKDVTLLHRYANAALVEHPFSQWTEWEKDGGSEEL